MEDRTAGLSAFGKIVGIADENALYPFTSGLGLVVYHSFDVPFYYFNLRANVANRVNKFLNGP